MRSDEPLGHDEVLSGLWRAARAGRLAHALCFVGPEGVGKFLCAERLVAGLMCAGGIGVACGNCGPCKRLKIDSHPDVFVIDPTVEGLESISIGHVAPRADGPKVTIAQFLSLRPMEGGFRVVLVRESDRMVEEAQNALLKTLEEPGSQTVLVLETARPDRLLPTIHSRCVRVPFRALSPDLVERILHARGVAPLEARSLARMADGAPGLATTLAERGVIAMRALLEKALEPRASPLELAGELAEIEADFPGKTPAAQARARARVFLDLLAALLRDGLRIEAGIDPDTLPFGDLAAPLAGTPEVLIATSLDRILAARQDVDMNLAPDAAVERALAALDSLRSKAMRGVRC
ncbi:MAG: DNA polymerase III subunit [Planctomycetes bacterium]|nr:DNA polymerase III subunit [Planctomycetota bacterium]